MVIYVPTHATTARINAAHLQDLKHRTAVVDDFYNELSFLVSRLFPFRHRRSKDFLKGRIGDHLLPYVTVRRNCGQQISCLRGANRGSESGRGDGQSAKQRNGLNDAKPVG